MKKCPKCNGECLEESTFCGICGYKFTDNAEPEIINEENLSMENDNKQLNQNDDKTIQDSTVGTDFNNNLTDNNVMDNDIYEVIEEGTEKVNDIKEDDSNNRGNKGNKVVAGVAVGVIVAVLALATVLIFGKNLFSKKSGEEKLVDAYEKLLKANSIDLDYNFSFTDLDIQGMDTSDPQAALVANIIKDFSFDVNTKMDKKEHIMEGVINVNMQNNKLMAADFYVDKELVGINIPFIYDRTLYVTWDSLFNKIKEKTDISIDWKDYLELLDKDNYPSAKNIDKSKYNELTSEFVKGILGNITKESVRVGDKNISCDKYPLQFDYSKMMEFVFKIMDEMVTDKDAKAFIYEVVDKVSEKIIANEDYTYFDITEEEFKNGIEEFKNNYEDMLDELDGKTILQKMAEEGFDINTLTDLMEAGINIKADVFVDKNNTIRKVDFIEEINDTKANMKMGVKLECVINSIDKKLEFNGVDKSEGVNPIELDQQQIEELIVEMQNTIMGKVMTNPFLSQLIGQFSGGQMQ
ncbi:hypothetical protein [Vallitalea sp.]|jgi:hypothetical protein|uniref:hypothetical protein n=1 Tax=Vallitalea sp. TaxID=1882829 RepID=UPI0025D16AC2|nr:hypothetical protein [Vallitalea sp.]MCT4688153.1 zinc ribbon domain-containing protein [Vallitalea sp.]